MAHVWTAPLRALLTSCSLLAVLLLPIGCNRPAMVREKAHGNLAMDAAAPPMARNEAKEAGEEYDKRSDNPFHLADKEPLSTFSIDVDTASYTNVRRMLMEGT